MSLLGTCAFFAVMLLHVSNASLEIETLEGHSAHIHSVAADFGRDRAISAGCDHTLKVWNLSNGHCLKTLEGHSDHVHTVAADFGRDRAISGSADCSLKVWDLSSGRCLKTLEGHSEKIWSVAADFGRDRAISASNDNTVKVWALSSGHCLKTLEGHSSNVWSVVADFGRERAISGGDDRTLKIWDLSSGRCLKTLEVHSSEVWSIAADFRRDRAISGGNDNTLKVWDLSRGHCLKTLEGHSGDVSAVAADFGRDRAISASYDNTLKVWDLSSGRCLKTLHGHSDNVCAVAADFGRDRAISGSYDRTVKVWRGICQGCSCDAFHCTNGKAVQNATCPEHEAKQCTSCDEGYHLGHNSACEANACRCQNGKAAQGDACPEHESVQCTSCDEGYHLGHNSACEANACRCQKGKAAQGDACPEHESVQCTSCDEGYHLGRNGGCEANACRCQDGKAAQGEACSEHEAEECVSCSDGHHLGHNGACEANACRCQDGKAAQGEACSEHEAEECVSCSDGHHLGHNGGCEKNECRCQDGKGAQGDACPEHETEWCASCDGGYLLGHNGACTTCRAGYERHGAGCALVQSCARFARMQLRAVTVDNHERPNVTSFCNESGLGQSLCTVPPECRGSGDGIFIRGSVTRLGIPWEVGICLSAALIVIPLAALCCLRAHLAVKVEIAMSSADLASDVLVGLMNEFYNPQMMLAQWFTTLAAAALAVAVNFGRDIVLHAARTWRGAAFLPAERLGAFGFHQVFELIEASSEKFTVNALATVSVAVAAVAWPLLLFLLCVLRAASLFVLGFILQGTRLLYLSKVVQCFTALFDDQKYEVLTDADMPVVPAVYHRSIVTELILEAIPSIGLSVANYFMMHRDGFIDAMSWPSVIAILVSLYLVYRTGFKYTWKMAWEGKSLNDIEIPLLEAPSDRTVAQVSAVAAVAESAEGIVEHALAAP